MITRNLSFLPPSVCWAPRRLTSAPAAARTVAPWCRPPRCQHMLLKFMLAGTADVRTCIRYVAHPPVRQLANAATFEKFSTKRNLNNKHLQLGAVYYRCMPHSPPSAAASQPQLVKHGRTQAWGVGSNAPAADTAVSSRFYTGQKRP